MGSISLALWRGVLHFQDLPDGNDLLRYSSHYYRLHNRALHRNLSPDPWSAHVQPVTGSQMHLLHLDRSLLVRAALPHPHPRVLLRHRPVGWKARAGLSPLQHSFPMARADDVCVPDLHLRLLRPPDVRHHCHVRPHRHQAAQEGDCVISHCAVTERQDRCGKSETSCAENAGLVSLDRL